MPSPIPVQAVAREYQPVRPLEHGASWGPFLAVVAALITCFALPLYRLGHFALGDEFYSYVVLMPVVSIYLIKVKRLQLSPAPVRLWFGGFFLIAISMGIMLWRTFVLPSGKLSNIEDDLCLTTAAFYLAFIGVALLLIGKDTWRKFSFPFGLLAFAIPMPLLLVQRIETFLQYGSAWTAEMMLKFSAMPVMRTGLVLHLSTIELGVAPECSGIHSSWILLITSCVAACLFLRSPVLRAILIGAVLPLAFLRNGFRIFVIGQLCVRVGPQMINHWIHRRGGPVFFVLSLIPFFALLIWLHLRERKKVRPTVEG